MIRRQGTGKRGTLRRPRGGYLGSTTAARRSDNTFVNTAPAEAAAPLVPPSRALQRDGNAPSDAAGVTELRRSAGPCGLRSTQRSMLVSIARAGRPPMGEFAASLVLDRSALAHKLKPLEREGLVEVVADKHDK
jgi:hypothetical protein